MNPELIKRIEQYKLNKETTISTINAFLNTCISSFLYQEIEGEGMIEKTDIVYNYLQNIEPAPVIKDKINIVIADDSSSLEYVRYLSKKYEVIVHKTKDVENAKDIDLVLFTGGEDVNPKQYGEKIGRFTGMNSNKDNKEIDTYGRFSGNSFTLGICRGSQLLTVLNGGKLIQHTEGHCKDHDIVLKGGQRYRMTSSHHQMMYPFNLNKNNYEVLGYSEFFQSNTYLNGDNEEIKLPREFLEPEIVYYKNTNTLCIQGHPEWSHCEEKTSDMCLNLIDKHLKEFKKLKEQRSIYTPYPMIDNVQDNYNEEYNDYDHEEQYEEEHI